MFLGVCVLILVAVTIYPFIQFYLLSLENINNIKEGEIYEKEYRRTPITENRNMFFSQLPALVNDFSQDEVDLYIFYLKKWDKKTSSYLTGQIFVTEIEFKKYEIGDYFK